MTLSAPDGSGFIGVPHCGKSRVKFAAIPEIQLLESEGHTASPFMESRISRNPPSST